MQEYSYALRCKPSWWTEYKDPKVVAKWKAEILDQEKDTFEGERLSEAEIDYILAELAGYDKMRDESTGLQQSCFAGVYESDALIPEELRQRLLEAVKPLEGGPDEQKDWRPQCNNQVRDLVDPSLYCGVYGRTLAYHLHKDCDDGGPKKTGQLNHESHAAHVRECPEWAVSEQFTWIPTDFDITEDGRSAKAVEYINNVHPSRHSDLHKVIEEVVARFSFLWDRVLTDLHPRNPVRYRINDSYEWDVSRDTAPYEDSYDDEDAWHRALEFWREDRFAIRPTVDSKEYTEDISSKKELYSVQGKRVQVFVKLFNIVLVLIDVVCQTPENPIFLGTPWRVEGMANERIIACGTYCYESKNIMETEVSFRTAVCECFKIDTRFEDETGLFSTYGLSSGREGFQKLGSVKTPPGRCIAFQNLYQHRISSLRLMDETNPGHRKIIALFLVDPECTIPSTTQVPPQQSVWIREAIGTADTLFSRLPIEVLDMVEDAARAGGSLLTLDESKAYRLEMMERMSRCEKDQNKHYFETKLDFED
ncbi:hypothetical protein FRC04_008482 [Tulasnella sp. 424]|nr:hypothetical protein FRC04_008482 [Tulasnella sp. 424]